MDAGALADLLHQRDVAAQVESSDVDDGANAAGVSLGQGGGGGVGDGRTVLEARIGGGSAGRAESDVFVAEGEAEVGGIDGAEDGVDLRHGGSLPLDSGFRRNNPV